MKVSAAGSFSAEAFAAPSAVDRAQRVAWTLCVLGSIGCAIGALASAESREYLFRGYLVGWIYCTGIAMGCLSLNMLHHMSGGAWGMVIRRPLEAATRTLPHLLVLSLPILLSLKWLYLWARPGAVARDKVLQWKQPYLNAPFFIARLVLYFVLLYGLAFLLNRYSSAQDRSADPRLPRRMRIVAGPGIVLYCLLTTFAAVDWLLSLDPHWSSTMYGFYMIASQALAGLSFIILISYFLWRREPMDRVLAPRHFHDFGNLLLTCTMLWTYFCFSQYLIIWAGNLPDEISWFLDRTRHGWGWVAMALVVFHFAVPFVLLLSRDLKRKPALLAKVAGVMLFMRLVDIFWQAEPSFHELQAPAYYWLYLAAPLALGGFWLGLFFAELKKQPLVPINDPRLAEAVAHE